MHASEFAKQALKHLPGFEPENEPQDEPVVDDVQADQVENQPEPEVTPEADETPETRVAESAEEPRDESPSPSSTVVRDFLREAGYHLSDDLTDADLAPQISDILGRYQHTAKEREELEQKLKSLESHQEPEILTEYQKHKAEFEEYLKSKGRPQDNGKPDAKPETKNIWGQLEFDEDWERASEFNRETGQWEPLEKYGDFGRNAARKLNEYYRIQAERARKLASDPVSAIREAGLDQILQSLKEELTSEVGSVKQSIFQELETKKTQAQKNAEIEDYLTQNASEFFVVDKNGNYVRDLENNYIPTEKGNAYFQAVQYAQDRYGINDEARLHAFAVDQLNLRFPQQQQQEEQEPAEPETKPQAAKPESQEAKPEPEPKQTRKEKQNRFLDRVTHGATPPANRDGLAETHRRNGETARQMSFREAVLHDMDNADVLGGHFKG